MRNRKLRHYGVGIELEALNTLGNIASRGYQLRVLREKLPHLILGLEILLTRIDEALLIGHLGAGRKREQHIMRIVVILVKEVHVVRRYNPYIELLAKLKHPLDDLGLTLIQVNELAPCRHRYV